MISNILEKDISKKLKEIQVSELKNFTDLQVLQLALNLIDLTTLEGNDTHIKVEELCRKAKGFSFQHSNLLNTAAVCVYPVFIETAKKVLSNSEVKVASVAGAFPSGQSPIEVKVAEVEYAVSKGADEIDMVISRGLFLEGEYQTVSNEIKAIKKVCKEAHLKVILETGELQTYENIYKASVIAMESGADFIKTSTGKININATPEAAFVMVSAIKEFFEKTTKMVGFKPAGGIATPEDAILYIKIVENVLGEKWLNNKYFRIGASRLADRLVEKIINY